MVIITKSFDYLSRKLRKKRDFKVGYNEIQMDFHSHFQYPQRLSGRINEKLSKKVVILKA